MLKSFTIKLFLILFLATNCFAEIVIPSYEPENVPRLNYEARRTNRRLLELENALDINDRTSGILDLDRGGTSSALVDPGADRIFFWDDSEGETDWLVPTGNVSITTTTLNSVDTNTSNGLFSFAGNDNAIASFYVGTSLTPGFADVTTPTYMFWVTEDGSTYRTIIPIFKWVKISTVDTVTIYCRIWAGTEGSSEVANLKVDIGGANGNVSGTTNQSTPEQKSFTIDVSGLTDGQEYDVTIQLKESSNTAPVYCSSIIAIGS